MSLPGSNEMHPRYLLNMFFKRKKAILAFFFVTIIAVVAVSLLATPMYKAEAELLIKLGRDNVLTSGPDEPSQSVFLEHEHIINSEMEILRSRSLAEKVILEAGGAAAIYPKLVDDYLKKINKKSKVSAVESDHNLQQLAILQFGKDLDIAPISKSSLIHLSFRHPDPAMSANILNKLAQIYLDHHVEIRKTRKSYDFFRQQTGLVQKKLNESEEKLRELKHKYNISNFEEQKSLLLRQFSDLQTQLNETLSLETETENRIVMLRGKLKKTPARISREKQVDHNASILSALQSRLVELELQEKDLSSKYTDSNRLLVKVREEISIVRKKLAENEGRRYDRDTTGINPLYELLQQDLVRNETDKRALSAKAEVLNQQILMAQSKLNELNSIELELKQLEQEVESDRKNYDLYLVKLEETRITDAMDTEKISNATLVEPASPPLEPHSPKFLINCLIGLLIGTFGGLGSAFLLETLSDKLDSVEDVEKALEVPVLTSIQHYQAERA